MGGCHLPHSLEVSQLPVLAVKPHHCFLPWAHYCCPVKEPRALVLLGLKATFRGGGCSSPRVLLFSHVELDTKPLLVGDVTGSRGIYPGTGPELLRRCTLFTSEYLSIWASSPLSGHSSQLLKLAVTDSSRQGLILLCPGHFGRFVPQISWT